MYHDTEHNKLEFSSITELATYASEHMTHRRDYREGNNKFFGNTTWEQVLARCAVGYDVAVPAATKLLSKLESSLTVETTAFESRSLAASPTWPSIWRVSPSA